MAGDHNNIVVGSAQLLVNGVDCGFTQGGISFRRSDEHVDVDADQMAGVARKVKTFERRFLSTTLLEVTRLNMLRVFAEPDENSTGSQLNIGSATPTTREFELTVIGKGPNGGTRTWTFYRAISVDDVDHSLGARDAPSVLPVGFELLKDSSKNNQFGVCVDT